MQSKNARFHDSRGKLVPFEKVKAEYSGIRSYLLSELGPERPVAIRLSYGYRYFLSVLACMETGVPFVALNAAIPKPQLRSVKKLTGFEGEINDRNFSALSARRAKARGAFKIKPDSLLYVICTSGSTGQPKAVGIERHSFENFFGWFPRMLSNGVPKPRRILMSLDFSFDFSLYDVALFLLSPCSVYFSRFASGALNANFFKLAEEVESFGIDSLSQVTDNVRVLFSDELSGRFDLSSLKQVCVGGARFSMSAYRTFQKRLSPQTWMVHVYGPTETTVFTHAALISRVDKKDLEKGLVTAGPPFPGVKVKLMSLPGKNERVEIKKAGQVGEVFLGGEQVMRGYLSEPEKTRASIAVMKDGRYYKTGDLAFFGRKGGLFIVGRNDDTLKRRGYRVNLLDIDGYLAQLSVVSDSFTVALPHDTFEHTLISFIVPKKKVSEEKLFSMMRTKMAAHQIPDRVLFLKRLPLSKNGKVARSVLYELARRSNG